MVVFKWHSIWGKHVQLKQLTRILAFSLCTMNIICEKGWYSNPILVDLHISFVGSMCNNLQSIFWFVELHIRWVGRFAYLQCSWNNTQLVATTWEQKRWHVCCNMSWFGSNICAINKLNYKGFLYGGPSSKGLDMLEFKLKATTTSDNRNKIVEVFLKGVVFLLGFYILKVKRCLVLVECKLNCLSVWTWTHINYIKWTSLCQFLVVVW
jgi:hypothetical protein